jgi:hypothetical protein
MLAALAYQESTIDRLNRALFTFASYNAGPAKVARLRKEAAKVLHVLWLFFIDAPRLQGIFRIIIVFRSRHSGFSPSGTVLVLNTSIRFVA